jgi:hypothetical protein
MKQEALAGAFPRPQGSQRRPLAGLGALAVLDRRRALRDRSGRILAKSWTRGWMREGGNAK